MSQTRKKIQPESDQMKYYKCQPGGAVSEEYRDHLLTVDRSSIFPYPLHGKINSELKITVNFPGYDERRVMSELKKMVRYLLSKRTPRTAEPIKEN
jgi:hypothetical protein